MSIAKAFAAASALLLSATALAEQPTTFSELDADRNGAIDKQEVKANDRLAKSFETADRDQDGSLSQQEFAFAMAKIRSEADPSRKG